MKKMKNPDWFLGKPAKNQTIRFLDHMIFNLKQFKVENYVKREPKYLNQKLLARNEHPNDIKKRLMRSNTFL